MAISQEDLLKALSKPAEETAEVEVPKVTDFVRVKEEMDKAQDDTTPFAVVADDGITVAGDPNKTELNKHDFKIVFRFPKGTTGRGKVIGGSEFVELEYKDVYITPRNDLKIVSAVANLYPFFHVLTENGTVEDMDNETLLKTFNSLSQEMIDSMYILVESVLGIEAGISNYMTPVSVINTTAEIIKAYPEIVNEADVFFG